MTRFSPSYRATFAIDDVAGYEAFKASQTLDKSKGEYFVKRFRGPRPYDGRNSRLRKSMCLAKFATSFDVYVYPRFMGWAR